VGREGILPHLWGLMHASGYTLAFQA